MQSSAGTLVATVAGAAAGVATDMTMRRMRHVELMSGVFLVTAAMAYPLADLSAQPGPERSRELAGVAAAVAVGLCAARTSAPTRRRLLAAGWLSHAAFDAGHRRSRTSRLPRWYPAFCAGFDAAVAAELLRPRGGRSR